jgi:magnesium-transporting ATPase (P-type)
MDSSLLPSRLRKRRHIWNARTRVESIFTHGLFANVVSIYGALAAVFIACLVVYVPVFHRPTAFETGSLGALFWTPHLAFGVYIFALNEWLKWTARNRPESWVARRLAW